MVPKDDQRPLAPIQEYISTLPVIHRGAESEIRKGRFLGVDAVFKVRVRKEYMHPRLDEMLRRERTRREARLVAKALDAGVNAPRLLLVSLQLGLIVFERLEGPLMKEAVYRELIGLDAFRDAGCILARLHRAGIAHGDPTTSNFMLHHGQLYIIDFGLSTQTNEIEDMGVDIHLFKRSLLSGHAEIADEAMAEFTNGYIECGGSRQALERARDIELRGRYVEERRLVWGR